MQLQNSEAPTSCDSQGFVLSINPREKTNMKSIANSELNFHGTALIPVTDVNGIWLTSADVAKALGYKSTKSISNLFAQYEDEFSHGMTMVIESVTNGINGSSRRMKVLVFSLRGAHLIAMFARTPVAKEFRRWVLDILDREVQQGNAHPAFDFEIALHNARGVNIHLRAIKEMWRDGLEEALKLMEHKNRGSISERLRDMTFFSSPLEISLNQHSKKKKIH
ncbi:BRO family protein [Yersinia ruckeri]|nr:BRO family protein [Yersinia ruckeri]MCW6569821.1 BRO family protein [Yersinia ruckeri]